MANPTQTIHVVHEIEGGSLKRGFTDEADARNWFNFEVADGKLSEQWFKISPLVVEDMSPRPKLERVFLDDLLNVRYTAGDYQRGVGPVRTAYQISNDYTNRENGRAMVAMIINAYEDMRRGIYKEYDFDQFCKEFK